MSALHQSEYDARGVLEDFYHNLPDKTKWRSHRFDNEKIEQYLKQYTVPNISKWGRLKDYAGDRDVFFYSGGYLGYHLADGGGGYVALKNIHKQRDSGWNYHPKILNAWSHSYETWDITDLVLNIPSNDFLNWLNENPFEVKQ